MKIPIPFTNRCIEIRSTLANPESWLREALTDSRSNAGVSVSPDNALQATAVFACVRVLAETVASLPVHVYRRLPTGGKERATDHYLYPVLHDQPNPEMTSFELRETLMGHLCLRGNAYCEIVRDNAARVRELWPLRPDKMTVRREDGKLVYYYTLPNGETVRLRQDQIFHLRGLSGDGIIGYSPIRLAREAVGLSLATEEFGARFFSEGAHPGGIVEYPGSLNEEALKRFKESVQEAYGGLGKSHRLMILEQGIKYTQVGIPPEDAQFLSTREFQVIEIARIFRVPPYLLQDFSRATFSNVEHTAISFVVHTVRPWLVRWEQAIKRDLFAPEERSEYFAEFLVDGLLRGDIESRYRAYATARQWGWMSADDIRELENMNPLPDGQGKVYLVPLNMVPAKTVISGTLDSKEEELPEELTRTAEESRSRRSADMRRRHAQAFRHVFEQAAARVVRREKADIMRQAEKMLKRRDLPAFNAWLGDFYLDHRDFVLEAFLPVFASYAEAVYREAADEIDLVVDAQPEIMDFVRAYAETFAIRYTSSSLGQLRAIIRDTHPDELLKAIEQRLTEWEEKRPGKIAMNETVRAGNAVTKATYVQGGVTKIKWDARGAENCPYCQSLEGKVISINGSFLQQGESLQPEGTDKPLTVSSNIGHPPAHGGCDCQITAVL